MTEVRNNFESNPNAPHTDGSDANFAIPDFTDVAERGLYVPELERDACGVGMVANITGERSHEIVNQALEVLVNLDHRGAAGADPLTGDGAGITIQMPDAFMRKVAGEVGIDLPAERRYGVAMTFLPLDDKLNAAARATLESAATDNGLKVLGWRDVPVDPNSAGITAQSIMPKFAQLFVEAPDGVEDDDLERLMYLARKSTEKNFVNGEADPETKETLLREFYVCSWSARTLIYKGMLLTHQLGEFYLDLKDESMVSAFGLVHSRFSTNTLGSWKLAHPYRMLAHNGEINTVRGNRNWMQARERSIDSPFFGDKIDQLTPICEADDASDTASLDNVFELLRMTGRSVEHTAAMMMPAAWNGHESMPQNVKDFYEYHGNLMEPWDGPAMIVFTDGDAVGAVLDRNGLRPFRYWVTKDNLLVMASEAGVLNIDPERIKYRSRLEPGRMFLIDFEEQRIVEPDEVIERIASENPYGEWLENNRSTIDSLPDAPSVPETDIETLVDRQMAFGYSREDLHMLVRPMAITGHQPQGSMGNDAPLAVLSDKPQNMFSYFKQAFAQVSNPPLDAIREKLITQRAVPAGRRPNIFETTAVHCQTLRIDHPVLRNAELAKIKASTVPGVKAKTISTLFPVAGGAEALDAALGRIRSEASQAIEDGYTLLVLSDRGVDSENAFIPSLLATSAVHHHLIKERNRAQADIIVESGEPREVHHFATLFGYGASAINPYLALETIAGLRLRPTAEEKIPSQNTAEENFREAIEEGVVKTMAKMGISTLQGYIGAQVFEALGLSQELVDEYFTWTVSRISGIGTSEIALDILANHSRAYADDNIPSNLKLDLGGLYLWRSTGERHMWNPDTIALLQDAVKRNDHDVFKQFETASNDEGDQHITIRNMLEPVFGDEIPLDEVEPASKIAERFATGAISLGSISREAHETLAVATNRIGARSNTGEGGEDPERFVLDDNGDNRSSAVKQIASGRFGVTTNYLSNAKDLQIKMAQGAKPGEGGEIPGRKISDYIAYIRKTTPGVELISPPPHHDIYSIEDLAQLIHDLKNVNPDSRVHVKLVSVAGVGIIAAGVAKGKGDVVLISGDSGGTGASPLSSIRHAGLPWELGLAETQQVLVANGLRDRIVVQTDGQMKTSLDVLVGALLGAEEWGIATGALISMGCIMLRKCHLNTCSVGVATQDPELRKKFSGTPDAVVNYFMFLAEGLRELMAKMGFRTVNEMIGRVDKLKAREDIKHWKAKTLDLSPILMKPDVLPQDHPYQQILQNHGLENALDNKLIELARPAIDYGNSVEATLPVTNINRTVGATLSGVIAKKTGEAGLPDGSINFTFQGSAGQSFGAWLVKGITFKIEGDSNDYFGKGLSGGRLVITPPDNSAYEAKDNIIIGNVALYGSTGGEAYVNGLAGERFAVRNSAASAVVEGIGDHGCEYMTGGRVAILGPAGRNFGAGMSGGVAYVIDEDGSFGSHFNDAIADLIDVVPGSDDDSELKEMIEKHVQYTGSKLGSELLADWASSVTKFKKVFPRDYARVLRGRAASSESTDSKEGVGSRG
ncbi:MAG: glutamate synthase large subunit [Chloroflexi bacterium]|jgi:glutamate synthase domain-containing protein 2/glutamate synthase domain-containing protein 1/glutamate synthase domain-containing protein 3|nr:glutamate synthase large subunit [Chloroflexota bacterium]